MCGAFESELNYNLRRGKASALWLDGRCITAETHKVQFPGELGGNPTVISCANSDVQLFCCPKVIYSIFGAIS